MKKTALIFISVIFLFSTCALEIANVIGPGGGYVFYDKGNYDDGWRYLECAPYDMCELKDIKVESIKKAMDTCEDNSGGWYSFPWELPEYADMKKMLECFSYGLTRFSDDYYYLTFTKLSYTEFSTSSKIQIELDENGDQIVDENGDPIEETIVETTEKIIKYDPNKSPDHPDNKDLWEVVVLHKSFDTEANGKVEPVAESDLPEDVIIRVRPIRRF